VRAHVGEEEWRGERKRQQECGAREHGVG
jgi:hypothetical protein